MYLCVCVCEREREKERVNNFYKYVSNKLSNQTKSDQIIKQIKTINH